jgi:hypothetical protein
MADEVHEVVTLLLARMESNPEEFSSDNGRFSDRWERYISDIEAFGNEADKAALNAKLRDIWMDKIHEKVLDELCNGEDRRRKEAEDREYELHLAHAAMQQQQKAYVSQIQGMAGQLYGGGGGAGGMAQGSYDYDLDKYRNTPTGSITSAVKPKPSPYDKIMNALKKGK